MSSTWPYGDRRNRSLPAAHFRVPRSLLHYQGCQGFALNVLGEDQQRLADLAVCSSKGSRSFIELIFFS